MRLRSCETGDRRRFRGSAGFTLLELLVVLAIAGLVAGLVAVSAGVNAWHFGAKTPTYQPIVAVDRAVEISCEACGHRKTDQLPAVQKRLLRGFEAYDFRVACEKCGKPAKVKGATSPMPDEKGLSE